MKVTQRLYHSVKEIWDSYYAHPFVEGIGTGTLDIEKFRFYLIQDYLYLLDYAKVFALGVVKSNDEELMRRFSFSVNDILNGEMKIHKAYMERLGITKEEIKQAAPSISNTSYTSYMLSVAHGEGVLELLVSILACSWSYQMIGERLSLITGAEEHPFFGEWIKGYASEQYKNGNEELLELTDRLSEGLTEEKIKNLELIFKNCSVYESMFWDMAYAAGR